ncbi:hypothetical protein [Streptomyces sp. NPDC003006]
MTTKAFGVEVEVEVGVEYLANEGVVTVDGEHATLCPEARKYAEFRSWYTFLVGGYATPAGQVGQALRHGSAFCTRNGRDAGVEPRTILALGRGDTLYVIDMCRRIPGATAWGAEPDPAAFKQAQAHVEAEGLADRIKLVNTSAEKFLAAPPDGCAPDTIVFGYVLQDVLGQQGEDTVLTMLSSMVDTFPHINIVVINIVAIEVANEVGNPTVMRHGLARNFWNMYYLVHYFTHQHLKSWPFGEKLFTEAGLVQHGLVTTPISADSTGVELGYLLRGPEGEA